MNHDSAVSDVESLIATLREIMGPESKSGMSSAFVVIAVRMLARGIPVDVGDLRDQLGWDDDDIDSIVAYLKKTNQLETDEKGRFTAIAGLSLSPTKHFFRVGEVQLYTWCAIDTLFLPAILELTASISSACPVSGDTISLRVSPFRGVDNLSHPESVVSVVDPLAETSESCSPDSRHTEVDLFGEDGAFCSNVHFFGSMSNASLWHPTHPEAVLLQLRVAHRVAVTAWAEPLLAKARSTGQK